MLSTSTKSRDRKRAEPPFIIIMIIIIMMMIMMMMMIIIMMMIIMMMIITFRELFPLLLARGRCHCGGVPYHGRRA